MTWFGIVMFAYYVLNMLAAIYYITKGGLHSSPGDLAFVMFVNALFLVAILTVGTGFGVA